jgi:hypothetical protein
MIRMLALCPNCLGQSEALTPTMKLVGLFLLVPPIVAYFVVRAIRREQLRAQGAAPSAPASGDGGSQ